MAALHRLLNSVSFHGGSRALGFWLGLKPLPTTLWLHPSPEPHTFLSKNKSVSCYLPRKQFGSNPGGGVLTLTWYTYMCLPFGALFREICIAIGGFHQRRRSPNYINWVYFGQIIVKSTQFDPNWMLFFRKWYTDGWEIWQKIGIEIVRFSRSGRHIHVRFWWKNPPRGQHHVDVYLWTRCIGVHRRWFASQIHNWCFHIQRFEGSLVVGWHRGRSWLPLGTVISVMKIIVMSYGDTISMAM